MHCSQCSICQFDSWISKPHSQYLGRDEHRSSCEVQGFVERRRTAVSSEILPTGRRSGVSAEMLLPKSGPSSYAKCGDQAGLLKALLLDVKDPVLKVLAMLDKPHSKELVSALRGWRVAAGDVMMRQGESLDDKSPGFFIFGYDGEFTAYQQGEHETFPGHVVKEYKTSDGGDWFFGELAVLHGAPRAATVIARKACEVWSVDRFSFNLILSKYMQEKFRHKLELLDKCQMLEPLGKDERAQLADVMRQEVYGGNEQIIKQGEVGTKFYMVEKGQALARKDDYSYRRLYEEGECFGELALLYDQPRAANVFATMEGCTVQIVDKMSFRRLLGSLDSIREHVRRAYGNVNDPLLAVVQSAFRPMRVDTDDEEEEEEDSNDDEPTRRTSPTPITGAIPMRWECGADSDTN